MNFAARLYNFVRCNRVQKGFYANRAAGGYCDYRPVDGNSNAGP